jgi:hypothetical protein
MLPEVEFIGYKGVAWDIDEHATFNLNEFGAFANNYGQAINKSIYRFENANYSNEALSSFNDNIPFEQNNFQCSSVPTYLLIKYAQSKGLPLTLNIDGKRTLSATKNTYAEFMAGFRAISTARIAAHNATAIKPANAVAGDLMLSLSKTGGPNHSRLIYTVDKADKTVSWLTASGGCPGGNCTYEYPKTNTGFPIDTYRFNVFNK